MMFLNLDVLYTDENKRNKMISIYVTFYFRLTMNFSLDYVSNRNHKYIRRRFCRCSTENVEKKERKEKKKHRL